MPTFTKFSGFEYGDAPTTNGGGLWNTLTGVPTIETTTVISGNYSLRLTPSASTMNCGWNVSGNLVVVRVRIQLVTLPTSAIDLLYANAGAGNIFFFGYDDVANTFTAYFAGGTVQASSMTVTAGQNYLIDLRIIENTNPRTCDWAVDGIAQTQASSTETASTISRVSLGRNSAATFDAIYDDFAVSATNTDYPIGSSSTTAI